MNGGRLPIALCAAVLLGALGAAPAGAIGFLDEWGGAGSGPGELSFPVSVATGAAGSVYVADSENNRIQRFDPAGAFLGLWGGQGSAVGQFNTPESVAADQAGNVYVIDKNNLRVEKFDALGTFLLQWARPGTGPGQFLVPEGIAVGASGNVYVADAGNDRIEKFGPDGAFLEEWGTAGSGPGQFDTPDSVATDAAGNVYVADSGNDRVQKFSAGGAFIAKWGSTGDGPGQFRFPVAVATDSSGRVLVADANDDRIEKFSSSGAFLSQWGSHGKGPGQFDVPLAIAAGDDGTVYVADSGNDRIEAFGRLPAPEYGKTVNVGPVSGTVRVRMPDRKGFFVLSSELQVPVGAILDTTRGRMRLTSAKNGGGGSQGADFFDGTFKVLQPLGGRPVTVLKLQNPVSCRTGHPRATASGSRSHGLWGSGKGNFRSEGRHGSATVRGTIWWAQDRCDGTMFKVKRGVVTIRDFTNHRTLKLHRGETYLAPAG